MRTVITAVLLAVSITPALAQTWGKESLIELPGVQVVVEDLDEESEKSTGLTRRVLATTLELRLRQNGIRVVSAAVALNASLYLHVGILPLSGRPSCVYTVNLRMNQRVRLVRNPTKMVGAVTWKVPGWLGRGSCGDVKRKVLDLVTESVDEFANDYRAMNPKD